jgi:hypothetical protein
MTSVGEAKVNAITAGLDGNSMISSFRRLSPSELRAKSESTQATSL